jgi:hypothetical protein
MRVQSAKSRRVFLHRTHNSTTRHPSRQCAFIERKKQISLSVLVEVESSGGVVVMAVVVVVVVGGRGIFSPHNQYLLRTT